MEISMQKITLFVVLALGVVLGSVAVEAASTDVDLTAKDGTVLKATYMSPGRPGPAGQHLAPGTASVGPGRRDD